MLQNDVKGVLLVDVLVDFVLLDAASAGIVTARDAGNVPTVSMSIVHQAQRLR